MTAPIDEYNDTCKNGLSKCPPQCMTSSGCPNLNLQEWDGEPSTYPQDSFCKCPYRKSPPHPLQCKTCDFLEVNPNDDWFCKVTNEELAREIEIETHRKYGCASHSAAPKQGDAEQRIRDAFESGYTQGENDTVESQVRDAKQAAEEYIALLRKE